MSLIAELFQKDLLSATDLNAAAGGQDAPGNPQAGTNFTSGVLDKRSYNTTTVAITTTIGATPTATVNIQGSLDGTNWWNVPYRTPASDTSANTALTITTATTTVVYIDPKFVRYLKVVVSANTNVTFTKVLACATF